MDIQSTKIELVKTILAMNQDELNKRIDQSEADFQNNRFKSSAELLAKYE